MTITLKAAEAKLFQELVREAGDPDHTCRILSLVLAARRDSQGVYHIPSSQPGKSYQIDPVEGRCSCRGYEIRNTCAHMKAVNLRTKMDVPQERANLYRADVDELLDDYFA